MLCVVAICQLAHIVLVGLSWLNLVILKKHSYSFIQCIQMEYQHTCSALSRHKQYGDINLWRGQYNNIHMILTNSRRLYLSHSFPISCQCDVSWCFRAYASHWVCSNGSRESDMSSCHSHKRTLGLDKHDCPCSFRSWTITWQICCIPSTWNWWVYTFLQHPGKVLYQPLHLPFSARSYCGGIVCQISMGILY